MTGWAAGSESWIAQVARHDAFAVERVPNGTNLSWLRVRTGDAAAFRRRLRDRGVMLGAPRDGRMLVGVNETWNRRPAGELAELFAASL